MPSASMTGFARAEGQDARYRWAWEAKSVNGRGLDVRFRLPPGFDRIEAAARTRLGERFKRGSISLSLTLNRIAAGGGYAINQPFLDELLRVAATLRFPIAVDPPRLDGLLGLRGVIEPVEEGAAATEAEVAALDTALLGTLDGVLVALAGMRAAEGVRLAEVLTAQLDGIERLRVAAAATAALQPEAVRARLMTQLYELAGAVPAVAPERLAQEAALLASKADVREELDRLAMHIGAARALIADDGAVGRKLDFLCQELNRESNTVCSKSADRDLTAIGIELKVLIEQFREQIQNIE